MRSLIFLMLAVFGIAYGYSDKCNWGESYWCQNLRTAKDCGAYQHCKTTIWKYQKPKVDVNDDVCTYCETIIGDVRKFMEDQKDQETIKKYLESACAIIPDQTIATECKDLVDDYTDLVLDLIASQLDPQTVCSVMKLCNGFQDTAQHIPRKPIKKPKVAAEPVCTDCKKFLQDIKDITTSAQTEKEVEDYIEENLCAMMGDLADYCNQVVEAYIPEIMELLASEVDPAEVCAAMGLCGNSSTLLYRMRLQKSPLYHAAHKVYSDEMCLLCKTAFGELQTIGRDQVIQTDVENFIKTNLCSKLGSIKDMCDATVDEYLPELFELFVSETDPDTRCKALGFCASNSIEGVLRKATPPRKPTNPRSGTQCVLCEFVMKQLDDMLKANATEAEIEQALEEVCSLLPDTIKQECDDFVKEYGQAVIEMLVQELSPDVICKTLGLCSSNTVSMKAKPVKTVGDGELCGTCETLMQYFDSLLEENSTVQEIERVLEKVCNFLPDKYKEECDDIVETYGPAVIQLIAEFADPKEVCQAVGLCPKKIQQTLGLVQLVRSSNNIPLLGQDKCTWGPAHWCENMNNAIKCQAVDHCKKHFWNDKN